MKSKSLVLYFTAIVIVSCSPTLTNQTLNKKREGHWIEKYSLDSLHYRSVGHYTNDEPIKKWRYYLDGEIIKKEKYKARFCKTRLYHKNGRLQSKGKTVLDTSGKYPHWYYDGEWKSYNNDGRLLSRRIYREGQLLFEKME